MQLKSRVTSLACFTIVTAFAQVSNPVSSGPVSSGVIVGSISTEDGHPAVGAQVTLHSAAADRQLTTDSTGWFQSTGLAPGAWRISAAAAGLNTSTVETVLPQGLSGIHASFVLTRPGSSACAPENRCIQVTAMRPSEVVRLNTSPSVPAAHTLAVSTPQAVVTNTAADFTIQTTVVAPAPPRFGFNFIAQEYSVSNNFVDGGGMDPYDSRFSFSATAAGTANTFIDNDCAGGSCPGTDFYQSIAGGYFNGAQARVYHFDSTADAWKLINSGTVSNFTANSASTAPADHTITLSNNGQASQSGDAIWLSKDAVLGIPDYRQLDPRLQSYGHYSTVWTFETGPAVGNTSSVPVSLQHLQPFSFDTDAPPGDSFAAPGTPQPSSMKLTDANNEVAGINQYYLGTDVGPGTTDSLQPGHTYQISLWLKQSGVANGSVTFTISSNTVLAQHVFTGVSGTWQPFTWQFPGFSPVSTSSPAPQIHIDYQAPGTLWIAQVQISDIQQAPFTIDSRVMQAWQDFAPQTIRIWSNFGNSGGNYSFWSLDSWLAADSEQRVDPGIGNIYEIHTIHENLPSSLNLVKTVGADPWLIVGMSLSEAEWGNLIDYLAAPAGVGYAAKRPASHPGPYTADFNHIYLEFGNEEWGTQETAVNGHYGEWVHYMLSQAIAGKSYFDPSKIKFIVNGFTLSPDVGSTAAAAAPEASVVDLFSYNSGDTTLSGDAYFQTDLLSLVRQDATLGNSVKNLIDAQVARQKQDAAKNLKYDLAIYEGGPGADTPVHQGDTSLAAAVGNLDVFLYASQSGFQNQNFFGFNLGLGPYTSHSFLYEGFIPHPSWQALLLRNKYCNGDMVGVQTNSVPVTSDTNKFPLVSVYAFSETTSSGKQVDIVVLSRDLNNQTPVTLRLPSAPSGSATIYTFTGDPRTNNDTALNIPIGTITLSNVSQNLTVTIPPGSIYVVQVPLASTVVAPPAVSVTSPPNGATVTGAITLTASATAASGRSIASVQFLLNGANTGPLLTAAPYTTTLNTASLANGTYSITAQATDNQALSNTSSPITVTVANTGTGTATASFLLTDATTEGNWQGAYGADGSIIPLDSSHLPAYATAAFSSSTQTWNWTPSGTSDPRALLKYGSTTQRIGSTFYNNPSFSIDLNLTDGQPHRLALYLSDFDYGGRVETITLHDATTNALLDTRNLSSFNSLYVVWRVQGHITIQATDQSGANAIINGLFLDTPTTSTATAAASFLLTDSTTEGNWQGVYGSDGSIIPLNSSHVPAYATIAFSASTQTWNWAPAGTTDPRALLEYGSTTQRIASTFYANPSFSIDLNLTDGQPHRLALYLSDFDRGGRAETITLRDAASNAVLDTRSFSSFNSLYVVWSVQGHITIQATDQAGANAIINGLFLGPPTAAGPGSATWVGTDSTTKGNWQGVYGADGSLIPLTTSHLPTYATVGLSSTTQLWNWSPNGTSDTRALLQYGSTTQRVVTTYYNLPSFTLDVNLTDGKTHQLALYLMDWDFGNRTESITIRDASSNATLDTRTVNSFTGGVWLIWKVEGHVLIDATWLAGNNALINGVFFATP